MARERRNLVLPFSDRSDEGGRDRSDSDVNPPEAEYVRAIYCDAADSGPVRKGQPTAGRTGSPAVVVTDGYWLEGSAREGGSSRLSTLATPRQNRPSCSYLKVALFGLLFVS